VLPHPRLIGRTIFPKRESFTTPPHQDFIPIQGTTETYTAWFPLHDLPPDMGGLEVAAGSHQDGVYEFSPALGAGGLSIADPLADTWTGGPFEAGDVLFFHSMTAHRGVANTGGIAAPLDRRPLPAPRRPDRPGQPVTTQPTQYLGKCLPLLDR
jgi:ectoine hydroxylase-related dioxygenase (phytanoyl-CoA dioxygenase family)